METITGWMNPTLLAFVVVGVVILYMALTLRLIRRRAQLLWIPALVVAVLATLLYWDAFGSIGVKNWFTHLALSITTALDLFLFKIFTSLGLAPYFYVSATTPEALKDAVQSHLVLVYGLYLCAMWTTSILTVHLFARRFSSRLWLLFHRPSVKRSHLFFGESPYALALAKDLAKDPENRILFILFPDQDALPNKLSVLQMIRGFRSGTGRERHIRQHIPSAIVLSARETIPSCPGKDFFREMGLPALKKWVSDEQASLYFLSAQEEENLAAVQKLPPCPCTIYCRAGRSGLNETRALVSDLNVKLVDNVFLTVKQMKMDRGFYPVRFVEKGLDAQGEPAGWVRDGFRAMVLGFSDTGRGILSFLYEFGAFVNENGEPAPFYCEVVDRQAEQYAGVFRLKHPSVSEEKVGFVTMEIGSDAFWRHFTAQLDSLNYIAVALGDDQVNVRVALDLLGVICFNQKSVRPAIVVKLNEPAKYQKVIDFYARSLGLDCIRILGGLDVWTESNIVDEKFEQHAKAFYTAYCQATGDPTPWDARIAKIRASDTSPLWKKLEYRRKVGQDYSDYMHMGVKAELVPARLWQDPAAADAIPVNYSGSHCTDPSLEPILRYLAIGEHLRWQAAHEMEGYRFGPVKKEDIKIHPALMDYKDLTEDVRHFDWIVVKTTLQLLYQEWKSNNPA